MPSEQKTPLGLNQWTGEDRPKREDFNSDNAAIDLACRSALEGLAGHLEGALHITPEQLDALRGASQHRVEGIVGEGGLHGLRYFQDRLEVLAGGIWIACGGGDSPPAPPAYHTYGVCIDTRNPDPDGAVTYTDDAAGMSPCSAAWRDTFVGGMRPCLLKNGAVTRYLDPGSYGLDENGAAADITTGQGGDVMVEIPLAAYAIYQEGDKLYVKVTDNPQAPVEDPRFCLLAHTRAQPGDRQKLYVGAYLGCVLNGRLRSLSGQAPQTGVSLQDCRALARQQGDGYDLLSFYPFVLLQCFALLYSGGRDTQGALGMGLTRGPVKNTGGTDGRGLFYSSGDAAQQMKAFGLEDFWGNCLYWLDGVRHLGQGFETATASFTAAGAWSPTGDGGSALYAQFISSVCGNNRSGFLGAASLPGASYQTHWCDAGEHPPSSAVPTCCCVGGSNTSQYTAGAFGYSFYFPADKGSDEVAGRLMYL